MKLLLTNAEDGNTGHIITHGIDYTPDYDGTHRGFVPAYSGLDDKANSLLFGDASWRKITVADLPMVAFTTLENAAQYTDEKLFSALSVWNLVDSKIEHAFKANDAMQFIGGINLVSGAWVITSGAGTITTLDSGYTFKASADFDFGSERVEAGDVLVYTGEDNKSITHADALNIANWLIIEGNVKNTSEFKVNGTSYHVESQENGTFTIFAPSEAGTKGSILYSTAGTPAWATPAGSVASVMIVAGNEDDSPRFEALTDGSDFLNGEGKFVDQSTITAGKLYGATTGTSYNAADLFSNFALVNTSEDATGKVKGMTITVGDTPKNVEWSETGKVWDITASAVEKALKVDSNTGIKFDGENEEYTGTEERTLSLITSANDQFGVIKVDAKKSAEDPYTGKGIEQYEGLPTVSMDNGLLYLNKANVCAALGFEPGNLDQTFTYKLFVSSDNTTITENEALTNAPNPYINFTSTHKDGDTGELTTKVDDFIQYVGLNAIAVRGSYNKIEIDTPYAFTGLQVRTDANEATALTTLVEASETDRVLELLAGNGISLAHSGTGVTINTNLVSSNENHLTLTSDASGQITIESIWRDVQINGTSVGVDTNINFVSTPDVIIATASVENEGTATDEIGFCIAWHNIETNSPELIAPNAISNQA